MKLASTLEIIQELKTGKMVILVDEEDRENEGDLVIAADFVTPEAINFMAKHGRGLVCLTLTQAHCQRLNLSLMTRNNGSQYGTAFTLSIEATQGVTTGISAADRAHTIKTAIAAQAKPEDLVQPGHVFPIMAQPGGVLVRAGHTEAGCDLTQLAQLTPAAVICEIIKDDGTMARLPDLIEFAQTHQLKIGTIADLIQYRSQTESIVKRVSERTIQTHHGEFQAILYVDQVTQSPHLALVRGKPQAETETLVRVHEPLSPLDLLETQHTHHSWPLDAALQIIDKHRLGAIVMLNCESNKQQIIDQFEQLNHFSEKQPPRPVDFKTYGIGAQILKDVGVGKMQVLANLDRINNLSGYGLEITQFIPYQPIAK